MSDNCLISHEIMNQVKKRKNDNSFAGILKIDLSKTYDRIKLDFVEANLWKLNFPKIWIQWIMQCITTLSYLILVNEEPTRFSVLKLALDKGILSHPTCFFFLYGSSFKFFQETWSTCKQLRSFKVLRLIDLPSLYRIFSSHMMPFYTSKPSPKIAGTSKLL